MYGLQSAASTWAHVPVLSADLLYGLDPASNATPSLGSTLPDYTSGNNSNSNGSGDAPGDYFAELIAQLQNNLYQPRALDAPLRPEPRRPEGVHRAAGAAAAAAVRDDQGSASESSTDDATVMDSGTAKAPAFNKLYAPHPPPACLSIAVQLFFHRRSRCLRVFFFLLLCSTRYFLRSGFGAWRACVCVCG